MTLLAGTVDAARTALQARDGGVAGQGGMAGRGSVARPAAVIVVGPVQQLRSLLGLPGSGPERVSGPVPEVLLIREDPPFSGPAAAVATGLTVLTARADADADAAADAAADGGYVLVLACDMPRVSDVVSSLLSRLDVAATASTADEADGWLASDRGRDQPLAAIYRIAPLRRAVERARASGSLANASVFRLIASLDMVHIDVPAGSTADVDSWGDAAALGVDGIPGISPPDAAGDE